MEAQIAGKTIVTLLDVPVQPKGFLFAPAYGCPGGKRDTALKRVPSRFSLYKKGALRRL